MPVCNCSQDQDHSNYLAYSFFLTHQLVHDFLRTSLELDHQLTKQNKASLKLTRVKAFCLNEPETRKLMETVPLVSLFFLETHVPSPPYNCKHTNFERKILL